MNTARIYPFRRRLLLCASILLLFVSATTRDFGITPVVARSFGPIAAALVEPFWKLLLWILPALYIVRRQTRDIFGYLKLGNMRQGILWGLAGSFFFFLRLLVHMLAGWAFHLVDSFDTWLNAVILVGFVEETVFRGFLFQELKTWWMRSPQQGALPYKRKGRYEARRSRGGRGHRPVTMDSHLEHLSGQPRYRRSSLYSSTSPPGSCNINHLTRLLKRPCLIFSLVMPSAWYSHDHDHYVRV